MKHSICAAVLALSLSSGYGQDMGGGMAPASGSGLGGTVKLEGKIPKPKAIREIKDDAFCSTKHADKIYHEDVVVGEGGVLANVFVYVKKNAPKGGVPADGKLDQKGCIYEPHVLGLMVGQKLIIHSSDATTHNINCQAKLNKGFNEGMATEGMTIEKTFNLPELAIPVTCQVHPWMKAVIHVVDNPYFAVSGKDGKFSIAGLPAGEYEIEAIHEKFGKKSATVKVTAEGAVQDFTFKAE